MAGYGTNGARFGRTHWVDAFDGLDWGDEPSGPSFPAGGGLGQLTQVVMVGDQVVDVVRRPVSGSEYEDVALELRARGLLVGAGPPPPPPPPPAPPRHEQQLAWLAHVVGGELELARLGVDPLEPDDLGLDAVAPHLRDRVAGIDRRVVQWAPQLLGPEGAVAARRLLIRAVGRQPALVTRSDRDDLAAGAVLWAVAKGNDLVGQGRPVRAVALQEVCGLRSTPSSRGEAFAHALGGGSSRYGRPLWMYDATPAVVPLGSPDLLLSGFRRQVVALRDRCLALRSRMPPVDDGERP